MTELSDVLLPAETLVWCLNAALATGVACAIAVVLSRRTSWPLPVRHALLVAALGISLGTPLAMWLFRVPSVWAIGVCSTSDQRPLSVVSKPIGVAPPHDANKATMANSISTAAEDADGPPIVASVHEFPASVAADPVQPARAAAQPSFSMLDFGWIAVTFLCLVWLIGIAVGIVRTILDLARFHLWRQTTAVTESPLLAAAALSAAESAGVRQKVAVYRSSLLPAPVSFGLIHPRIVVPTGIESRLAADQLRAVLVHEMAHVARRDLWIGLLQQAAQIVHWWNPLVHGANQRLADLREQICDDIAIRELSEPSDYAATLVEIAARCSNWTPLPATLGVGSSSGGQLEARIRRILSAPDVRCLRLSRRGAAGVSALVVLTAATVLFAQVRIESSSVEESGHQAKSAQDEPPGRAIGPTQTAPSVQADDPPNPTLHELIQQMAAYEQAYLPFEVKSMETFRMGEDLTPKQSARYPWADGRKHQKLMEYAQLAKKIWRRQETMLVDDEVEQGPYESFSDGERIIQVSPSSVVVNGNATPEYYVNYRKNEISNYTHATPLTGVFCLSTYSAGELFSEVFQGDEEAVELAWDNGDAKLTFVIGKPHWNMQYVLWLSRAHAWHPVRLQRYWDAKDKFWFSEWEVSRFVPHGKSWRVAEGTQRYRGLEGRTVVDPKIVYFVDFKVLAEKYGGDVDEQQFKVEIPVGANVRDNQQPKAEPPPPATTREITVTVIDVANQPVPHATVRIPASRVRDYDVITTDENGTARTAKAPEGNATMQVTAPGCRPVTWIMGDVNKLRAIITPQTTGIAVDEQGNPVADAWLPNRTPQLRSDGLVWYRDRSNSGGREDWSGDDGRFTLKTELTLRSSAQTVPLIAFAPDLKSMAIQIVPAHDLGQPQKLVLRPVCKVHGHCLLERMSEDIDITPSLETSAGERVASVTTRRELTPEGLRIDFQLRLPPGDYVLTSRQSSHHSAFAIPVTVPPDRDDLDLGTRFVPATGVIALEGKPAPELDVRWRPGQETNWEKLRGKVVVLDFWGTWCRPCVAGMPKLMEIADQFQDKPVAWLSIHTPNLKDFDEFDREVARCEERNWNRKTLPFTAVLDLPLSTEGYSGKAAQRYGVTEWPTLIVIDQQGKVVGPISKQKLAETIAGLLDR